MSQNDLSIAEVLKDPLIRLMMRADRISLKRMRTLLADAALKQGNRMQPEEVHDLGRGP